MRPLTEADVDALARGALLLGSGGGGQTDLAALLLRRVLGGGSIEICQQAQLPAHSCVVPVGVVGATAVFVERLPTGEEFGPVVQAVVQRTGRTPTALMSIEAGGFNALTPMLAAVQMNLPIVDADLMGRALPRLDQLSLAVRGAGITPLAIGTAEGRLMLLDGLSAGAAERVVRSALTEFGGWAAIALAPIPGRALPSVALIGSLDRAMALGRAHARWAQAGTPREAATALGAQLLANGRVIDVPRYRSEPGFGRGHALIRAETGALVRVEMENEYLATFIDGQPVATTPDVLCLVDAGTGAPIPCDRVRGGMEVVVLRLAAPDFWRSPSTAHAVGPAAFGLDLDPIIMSTQ